MSLKPNKNFEKLPKDYLFSRIKKKEAEIKTINLTRISIGDAVLPIGKTIVSAMKNAANELGEKASFKGYPPQSGYSFLKQAIINDYKKRNIVISENEIFVSDGAKSDLSGLMDVFRQHRSYIIAPFYPVYRDAETIKGNNITYIEGNIDNNFLPLPDKKYKSGVYYITSPNNPTGATYDKNSLASWVEHALKTKSVIIFDAAYECFITENLPHSIYEIDGAEDCAIEVKSFSKSAGFTGVRCGYTVIPVKLKLQNSSGLFSKNNGDVYINKLWERRQAAFFNGVSYITQRGAEAALTTAGKAECKKSIGYYLKNAGRFYKFFSDRGVRFSGGVNSPYVFAETPDKIPSERFFEALLASGLVATPGAGFGASGEYFMRYSSFCSEADAERAVKILSLFY